MRRGGPARVGHGIGYIRVPDRGSKSPMPSNVEIKARIFDLPKVSALVATIGDTPPKTLQQRDTFFGCSTGRLKLRELETGEAELIFYARADVAGAKQSHYEIAPVADAVTLKSVLRQAVGEKAVVEKTRVLYLIGQTRVHLDTVNGLGTFLELEVVLRPGQSPAEGHEIAADLMSRLGIREADLVATAYADMLTDRVGETAVLPAPPALIFPEAPK